ncbi:MAG: solute carrier family 23 protein, partial [Pseudomonadota bacterium]
LVKRLRFALPPLVTGIVVLLIGLSLVRVGIQYAAGGVPAIGTPAYGAPLSWSLALVTILVTLGLRIFAKGLVGTASVLLGLIAGYLVALAIGRVDFAAVGEAAWISTPSMMPFGLQFTFAAVAGFCAMVLVSGIETIGDVSAIAESGAGRQATDKELTGAVAADGFGTALAAIFGALPNSSFSQNVGLVAMTGVMSRHVVALGAIFLIICGVVPKIGAVIISIPIEVLGGSVIIMFGMVAGAGISMLSAVTWNQRNLLIAALAISVGLGLQLEPEAVAGLPELPRILMTSGVVPAAFLAVTLNLLMPNRDGALSSPAH